MHNNIVIGLLTLSNSYSALFVIIVLSNSYSLHVHVHVCTCKSIPVVHVHVMMSVWFCFYPLLSPPPPQVSVPSSGISYNRTHHVSVALLFIVWWTQYSSPVLQIIDTDNEVGGDGIQLILM